MDVLAGQPIRSRNQYQLKRSHPSLVPQPVQTRSTKFGPTVTIISIDLLGGQMPLGLLGYGRL